MIYPAQQKFDDHYKIIGYKRLPADTVREMVSRKQINELPYVLFGNFKVCSGFSSSLSPVFLHCPAFTIVRLTRMQELRGTLL
jgi:hypothetical protein